MTLKIPPPTNTLGDRILRRLGKERALLAPCDTDRRAGVGGYAVLRPESFWRTLLRSRGAPLPEHRVSRQSLEFIYDETP